VAFAGYASISLSSWVGLKSTEYYVKALDELGVEWPLDGNAGHSLGAIWTPLSLDPVKRTRWTARNAYLSTERPNLHIVTGVQVTKILTSSGNGDTPCAKGVEVSHSLLVIFDCLLTMNSLPQIVLLQKRLYMQPRR
jgi:hypothetical protein